MTITAVQGTASRIEDTVDVTLSAVVAEIQDTVSQIEDVVAIPMLTTEQDTQDTTSLIGDMPGITNTTTADKLEGSTHKIEDVSDISLTTTAMKMQPVTSETIEVTATAVEMQPCASQIEKGADASLVAAEIQANASQSGEMLTGTLTGNAIETQDSTSIIEEVSDISVVAATAETQASSSQIENVANTNLATVFEMQGNTSQTKEVAISAVKIKDCVSQTEEMMETTISLAAVEMQDATSQIAESADTDALRPVDVEDSGSRVEEVTDDSLTANVVAMQDAHSQIDEVTNVSLATSVVDIQDGTQFEEGANIFLASTAVEIQGSTSKIDEQAEVSEPDVGFATEVSTYQIGDVADITLAASATTDAELQDDTSEEYVILEPVSFTNNICINTVTQAQSGLPSLVPMQVDLDSNFVQQCPTADEVKSEDQENGLCVNISAGAPSQEGLEFSPHTPYHQPLSDVMETNMTEIEMASPYAHEPWKGTKEHCNVVTSENFEANMDLQELQILEDIEIGREIVVAEGENDDDCNIIILEPPKSIPADEQANEKTKEDITTTNLKENSIANKKQQEAEKPKKQQMNSQARTKARLAALAEQKAAAAKRSAHRQQLNLLALCQEIAEDIATDSMLMKRIEEEKQAAAAKNEASKKKSLPVNTQEADHVDVVTPDPTKECPVSVIPPEELPATAISAEPRPVTEPPKRRFFISQVAVPLKAHEKKKLTRYQRLRQVELQREKMSWARVKKLKSDQANQLFSEIDWQAPMSTFSLFSQQQVGKPATTTSPPGPSPSKTSLPNPDLVSKSEAPEVELPKAEPPKVEPVKDEPPETQPSKMEPSKTRPAKAEPRKTRQAETVKAADVQVPVAKMTRSAAKRTLPAVPPPMPNGLTTQKLKPDVEYKPYRPRPKYSPDDFELDDDPLPVALTKLSVPTPNQQSKPTAQSKATLLSKPAVSSPTPMQTRSKAQMSPAVRVSGHSNPTALRSAQTKPSTSTNPQSKSATTNKAQQKATRSAASPVPVLSAKGQLKHLPVTNSQSKALLPPGNLKPAASATPSATPQSQHCSPTPAQPIVSNTSETKPAVPASEVPSIPQEIPNLPSSEDDKCKGAPEQLSSASISSLPSAETVKASESTQPCGQKPAVADADSSPENITKAGEAPENMSEDGDQDGALKADHDENSDSCLQKQAMLKDADVDGSETPAEAEQKHFGTAACSVCGMLYSTTNPEDESQHLLFHNQFASAVKYVGWKKERILAEYPDGKIILVLPDDPKYALKKVEEIREMVDNDLGFQQVQTKCLSQTKTFLFISNDKKVAGCLIAEHIQEGYRVIEDPMPDGSEGEKLMFERQRAWCCSTNPEPAICGISRIWVVSMMRRQGIASRMLECLRNNFIYGSYLSKDEIAFSDPTPDGKLFATHYFGTSQFLVYNFVSGTHSSKSDAV
ncbi:uncharacterized protein LOC117507563 isoform X2 [Thalassophryne amazonica]|uniref:uncharacterized protein LOC117507563 isoform X2 n=1 Tax=Thalassophryne amazonica TaxID=390379 RepID=UPI0014721728|nr:uncharacterized protein LOC117507563 isoform X2 [Thalassophryne amazonica]